MYFFVSLCLLTSSFAYGQLSPPSLRDSVDVSVLTCGPGDLLYSLFGHTAIRIQNFSTGQDLVYNYGTFAFHRKAANNGQQDILGLDPWVDHDV